MPQQKLKIHFRTVFEVACPTCGRPIDVSRIGVGTTNRKLCTGCRDLFNITLPALNGGYVLCARVDS